MSSTVYQVFVNYRLVKCGSEWHVTIPGQLKIYKMVFANNAALYLTNMFSWIFIVQTHWNNSLMVRHIAPLWHNILSQQDFALTC
jgi:hypothetical protein